MWTDAPPSTDPWVTLQGPMDTLDLLRGSGCTMSVSLFEKRWLACNCNLPAVLRVFDSILQLVKKTLEQRLLLQHSLSNKQQLLQQQQQQHDRRHYGNRLPCLPERLEP